MYQPTRAKHSEPWIGGTRSGSTNLASCQLPPGAKRRASPRTSASTDPHTNTTLQWHYSGPYYPLTTHYTRYTRYSLTLHYHYATTSLHLRYDAPTNHSGWDVKYRGVVV
jgi:hypothetical protein